MVFLVFAGLLLAITVGGWLLSEGAEKVSDKYGVNFAGSIVLALVTTIPEYMFVIFATIRDRHDMAMGSAIGACTLLVTLGYGSVILFATSRLSRNPVEAIELTHHTRVDAVFLLVTAVIALVLAWEGNSLDMKDGVILAIVFLVYVVMHSRQAHIAAHTIDTNVTPEELRRAGVMFAIGAVIIVACADAFVTSMVDVAKMLNVSAMAIAIIISPIASEMPEKITAYITVMRDGRLAEISIANFMGSKVNHNSLLLAVMPFTAAIAGTGPVGNIMTVPFLVMNALTVFAAINLMQRRLTRRAGWTFLLLYALIIFAAFETGVAPISH